MGHDAIQCTRAYLTLWKLVDRLFPDSRWLEIGAVPVSELRANAQKILEPTNILNWCDEENKLREAAASVLALLDQRLEEGVVARAYQLRAELRDQALKYAESIKPSDCEWAHTFDWELRKPDGT